jgi:hypothetical protein
MVLALAPAVASAALHPTARYATALSYCRPAMTLRMVTWESGVPRALI